VEEEKVITSVRGSTKNEGKASLIKRGYDVNCPVCAKKFNDSSTQKRVTCPNCRHSWRVNFSGKPEWGK